MANTGIRGYYLLTQAIKDALLGDINVNTVTEGDLFDIDLSKQSIFPLSHLIINTVTAQESVLRFNISILSMDIVDESKEPTADIFIGNNNEQDVLNTQLSVLNKLVQVLRRGDLYNDKYQLTGDANLEPFVDRFENKVAGWTATFDIFVNNDITIC
tara:strand:+ start:718 stop:1188 length:471 start_codon:yes stop_codon:yes gene_type:complete